MELKSDAKSLPNTIIADFHYLPKNLFGKFDFVYSNSHGQSFNPKLALGSWIKCLKVDGLLVLEHGRSHGKSRANRQDPFGVETEVLPFLVMGCFSANLNWKASMSLQSHMIMLISVLCSRRRCNSVPSVNRFFKAGLILGL